MSTPESTTTHTAGPSFAGLLFLVFLVLKLTGVISWSWWWVTAPLWITAGLALLVVVVLVTMALIRPRRR